MLTLGNNAVTPDRRRHAADGARLSQAIGYSITQAPAREAARRRANCPPARDAPRAGIIVTGTEVLGGRVRDRNGPWLADRLGELGVDLAYVTIVGDRPDDMETALRFMAEQGIDLVLTSGGLGPTADDLTAEVVGRMQGRDDGAGRGAGEAHRRDRQAATQALAEYRSARRLRIGTRKQATVPEGATVLEPVGTAPGLVVPPAGG